MVEVIAVHPVHGLDLTDDGFDEGSFFHLRLSEAVVLRTCSVK